MKPTERSGHRRRRRSTRGVSFPKAPNVRFDKKYAQTYFNASVGPVLPKAPPEGRKTTRSSHAHSTVNSTAVDPKRSLLFRHPTIRSGAWIVTEAEPDRDPQTEHLSARVIPRHRDA